MDFDCEVGYCLKSGKKRRLELTTKEVLRAGTDTLRPVECKPGFWFESPMFAQIAGLSVMRIARLSRV